MIKGELVLLPGVSGEAAVSVECNDIRLGLFAVLLC